MEIAPSSIEAEASITVERIGSGLLVPGLPDTAIPVGAYEFGPDGMEFLEPARLVVAVEFEGAEFEAIQWLAFSRSTRHGMEELAVEAVQLPSAVQLVTMVRHFSQIHFFAINNGCAPDSIDSDSDSAPDCLDECDDDPTKTEPGPCGCGVEDTDSDEDGTLDCLDRCDDDPTKTEPGLCGCGVEDTDSDEDGTVDCEDQCDDNPAMTTFGVCGSCDGYLDGLGTRSLHELGVVFPPEKIGGLNSGRIAMTDSLDVIVTEFSGSSSRPGTLHIVPADGCDPEQGCGTVPSPTRYGGEEIAIAPSGRIYLAGGATWEGGVHIVEMDSNGDTLRTVLDYSPGYYLGALRSIPRREFSFRRRRAVPSSPSEMVRLPQKTPPCKGLETARIWNLIQPIGSSSHREIRFVALETKSRYGLPIRFRG